MKFLEKFRVAPYVTAVSCTIRKHCTIRRRRNKNAGTLALMASLTLSAASWSADPNVLPTDGKSISGHITPQSFDATYDVEPARSAVYHFVVFSDRGPLSVWIDDDMGTPMQLAHIWEFARNDFISVPDDRAPRADKPLAFEVDAPLSSGKRYHLKLRSNQSLATELAYRLTAFRNDSDPSEPIPTEALTEMKDVLVATSPVALALQPGSSSILFRGRAAWIYRIRLSDSGAHWVAVSVKASGVIPKIYFFDPETHVLKGSPLEKTENGMTAYYQDTATGDLGLLVTDQIDFYRPKGSNSEPLTLSVNSQHYSPNGTVLQHLREILADPIVALAVGAGIGAVISWLFYRRSIARKRLCFQTISDVTIMRVDHAKQTALQVTSGGAPINENIGWCTTTVSLRSTRDISGEDVKEPIRLAFANISGILKVSAEARGGWTSVAIPREAPTEIQLNLAHLKPGDWIRLDVFYTQNTLTKVSVSSRGRILDGVITRRGSSGRDILPYLLGGIIVCLPIFAGQWIAYTVLDGLVGGLLPDMFLRFAIETVAFMLLCLGTLWTLLSESSPIETYFIWWLSAFEKRVTKFLDAGSDKTIQLNAEPQR